MILDQVDFLVLVGLATIIVEMFFVPGLGFLFFGMGVLTTAGIIYYLPDMIEYQYICIAILSCVWFVILWKPLMHYIYNKKKSEHVFDIIGSSVEVIDSDIIPEKIGKVTWSGTIMNARLKSDIDKKIAAGSFVEVYAIEGNVLIVGPITK